jgi:hypothetical protein
MFSLTCGVYSCVQNQNDKELITNLVTEKNHKQIVKLKPDGITCLKLNAKWGQKWDFKTCDDYELVTILEVKVVKSSSRFGSTYGDSVEIWMKVKQPFIIQCTYLSADNTNNFLYTKLEIEPKK